MSEKINSILIHLKQNNLSAQRVEKDLGFSNGVLGKAAKGLANLSEARTSQLEAYYQNKLVELGLVESEEPEQKDQPIEETGVEDKNPPPPKNDKYDFLNS